MHRSWPEKEKNFRTSDKGVKKKKKRKGFLEDEAILHIRNIEFVILHARESRNRFFEAFKIVQTRRVSFYVHFHPLVHLFVLYYRVGWFDSHFDRF